VALTQHLGYTLADIGFLEVGVTLGTQRELHGGLWAYGRILCVCELGRGRN